MAYAYLRSPQMVKHPIPYEKYLVEVGKRAGPCARREYMQMELILPRQPITQPPPKPNKSVQVKEADIDACMKIKKPVKKGKKGKKKGKKGKK